MSSPSLRQLGLKLQKNLEAIRDSGEIDLDGHGLDVAAVVAVARFVHQGRGH